MSGGTLMVWLRVCNASIGVPAAIRPITGTATGRLPSSSELGVAAAADLAERAFDDAGREAAAAVAVAAPRKLRQLDHFDGAGAVGQAANEAALFQRGDEAVDAGLRAQIERVLHLVEGGRNAGLFQPFIDETQKFVLFAREHLDQSPVCVCVVQFRDIGAARLRTSDVAEFRRHQYSKQIMNEHYMFHMCSATT